MIWPIIGRTVGEAARRRLVWLQAAAFIQEIIDIDKWSVERAAVSLLGLQKLSEVHL